LREPKRYQNQLVIKHFCVFLLKTEGGIDGRKALLLEAYISVYVILEGRSRGICLHNQGE
jgi:hypothetical protein